LFATASPQGAARTRKGLAGHIDFAAGPVYDFDDDRVVDVTLTITNEIIALGDYRLVAVGDWTGTDSDEPLVFHFDDKAPRVDGWDRTRCDHCGHRIARNKVLVVEDADGGRVHVGSTCAKDFLGHDPFGVFIVAAPFNLDDEDEWGWTDTRLPTESFVWAAALVTKAFGYRKACEDGSTKDLATMTATGRTTAELRRELADVSVDAAEVESMMEWAQAQTGGDFADNIARVASSEWVGPKAFGIAAYIPEGFYQAEGRRIEREAIDAGLPEPAPVPTTDKRIVIEGLVLSVKTQDNGYQVRRVMTVVDDRGFKVWGSVPSALNFSGGYNAEGERIVVEAKRGDRVTFTARVEPSDSDPTFGFYKRPTKAEILETNKEEVEV
jgi:hypothetical protein